MDLARAHSILFADQSMASADPRVLKRAHRRRVFDCHPDRAQILGRTPGELRMELDEVNQAYEVAKNPTHRILGAETPRPRATRTHGWSGRIPERVLPLGEFLYYCQAISWGELSEALAWQRRQRPMFGELARRSGILPPNAVADILRRAHRRERFGDCAVRLGFMAPEQRESLCARQLASQARLGGYFVEKGSLARAQLERLAHEHREHNRRYL